MVAPVPFVTTIASDPEEAVLLLMLRADPVVAPLILINTSVVDAVIEELVMVSVKSAAAAIDTDVNVALPDLPLTTTGPDAAPEAWDEVKRIPVPVVDATKFPFVVVIAPRVAVNVVVAVREPGAVIAAGKLKVMVLPEPVDVIWFAVPKRLKLPAVGLSAPPDPPVKVAASAVPGVIDPVIVDPDPANASAPDPVMVIFPAVGDLAPPEFPVTVETRAVPGVMEPVSVDPDPAKARAPEPITLIFPADGLIAPPELPVKESTGPLTPPCSAQVAVLEATLTRI